MSSFLSDCITNLTFSAAFSLCSHTQPRLYFFFPSTCCLHACCPGCVTPLMFPAAESSWSDRAPQNIYHPPFSPLCSESRTSHSLSLPRSCSLSRCLWLCPTLPLSTQFLLDGESCNTHYREQLGWRIFSYLPIPAEKGEGREEKKIPFSGSDLSTIALSSVSSLRRCIGCPLVFLMEYEWLQQLSFCHQLPCTISACSFLPEDTIVVCSMKM